MEILIFLIIVSLLLAAAGVGFFVWTLKHRTYEHSEQLSLMPLDLDDGQGTEE